MKLGLGLGLGFGRWAAAENVTAPVITMGDTGVFSIACDTAGATIYYTTDGSTPDSSSTQYTTPVTVNTKAEFRAIAINGAASSPVTVMQVWSIPVNSPDTQYITIRCKDAGQTISIAGGDAQIKLGADGTWGNSAVIPAGDADRLIYYQSGAAGGTLAIPNAGYVTYLKAASVSISGSINGMALTYLYLNVTGPAISGSINGMALTYLYLNVTGVAISGSIDGMALTFLFISQSTTGTGATVYGSINGMALTLLYLKNTGTAIYGTPPALGDPLATLQILGGTTYDYPWALQPFSSTKITWTAAKMAIDCVAQAPTVEVFDKWLKDLASVSLSGTATLVLKNTPTANDLAAAGKGQSDVGSGLYQMIALGYTMSLGQ